MGGFLLLMFSSLKRLKRAFLRGQPIVVNLFLIFLLMPMQMFESYDEDSSQGP